MAGKGRGSNLTDEDRSKGGRNSQGGGAGSGGSKVGSGKESDPNNFANNREKSSEAGRKGGKH